MPYDKTWAQDIVKKYKMMCARTHQIDLCIQQLYKHNTGRECLIHDIQALQVKSLQGVVDKRLWIHYKRLVKKTPLNQDLLKKVAAMYTSKIDADSLQRQFQWD